MPLYHWAYVTCCKISKRKIKFYVFYVYVCTATEDFWRLEISEKDCTIYLVKTKALICCTDTVQLICALVFAYAKSLLSYNVAIIQLTLRSSQSRSSLGWFHSLNNSSSSLFSSRFFSISCKEQVAHLNLVQRNLSLGFMTRSETNKSAQQCIITYMNILIMFFY